MQPNPRGRLHGAGSEPSQWLRPKESVRPAELPAREGFPEATNPAETIFAYRIDSQAIFTFRHV
jgi:hypothetical protein